MRKAATPPTFACLRVLVALAFCMTGASTRAQQQYERLHAFFSAAVNPRGALIQVSDGNFYGTTQYGGAANTGTIVKIDSSGNVTTLYSFPERAFPYAGLIQGSDGNFYGTTTFGGFNDRGTVFKMDASGTVTTLHFFFGSDGANPVAGLIEGSDGNFYGTAYQGGTANMGTAFKITSSGAFTRLHTFTGSDGQYPLGGLIQGSDGNFYGTTFIGGTLALGTIFKMDSAGMVTTLHSFAGQPADGATPRAGLIEASDGNFYGTTYQGGAANQGTVFKMDSSGTVTILHHFTGEPLMGQPSDGAFPYVGLMEGRDGNLYGTTEFGGTANKGTVFKVDSLGVVTTVHSFSGQPSDGATPYSTLVQANDGNFYGTTFEGGIAGQGTVFKMDSSGAVTTLYSFAANDGTEPVSTLMQASDTNFYGTTLTGGSSNLGAIFKMDASGVVTTIHSFAGSDGASPYARLIQGSDGNFYGTTYQGGTNNNGVVFKMDSSGAVTTLHLFGGQPADGANPVAGLIQASDGNFYGTTYNGGPTNNGIVFKMDSSGAVTTVYSFVGQLLDGAHPYAALLEGGDGTFYGTTLNGGTNSLGTVFKIDSSGSLTTLHSFAGAPSDGAYPYSGLIRATDGSFYATTLHGGTNDLGTAFKTDSLGALTILHSFSYSDGSYPNDGMIQGTDGYFYGTTYQDGPITKGTVFKMDSSGALTLVYYFGGGGDGALPRAGLIQGSDGSFYGTTYRGGRSDLGIIFRLTVPPLQLVSVISRKTHGDAGSFDVDLPLNGSGIECRSGGASNDYTLQFTFTNPLLNFGSARVSSGTGSVSSVGSGDNTYQFQVNLTGVTNAQVITVSLTDVEDGLGNRIQVSATMGVLVGDVNASGNVDAADVGQVQRQNNKPVTSSNFRMDVNLSGNIDAADVGQVQRQNSKHLP